MIATSPQTARSHPALVPALRRPAGNVCIDRRVTKLASIVEHLRCRGLVAMEPKTGAAADTALPTIDLLSSPRRLARLPEVVAEAADRHGARLIQIQRHPGGRTTCYVAIGEDGAADGIVAFQTCLASGRGDSLLSRWLRPSGMQIAVYGPDGIGKSSLLEGLSADLAPLFAGVRRQHFRPAFGRDGSPGSPVTDPHSSPPRLWPSSIAKLGLYTLDHAVGHLIANRPRMARGELILSDRHLADLKVDPRRYRYGGPPGLVDLALRAAPSPDLSLVLIAPAEVVQERASEVAPEETRRQLDAYRRLADRTPRAHVVDAAGTRESVLRRATSIVLDHLACRTHQRLTT